MTKPLELSQLYHKCDTSKFSFSAIEALPPIEQIVGQDRALEAIEFSADVRQDGFNLYAMGPSGSGKHSTIEILLKRRAKSEELPLDWCYLNNFDDSRKPIAISMTPGRGANLRDEIKEMIDLFKKTLPAVYDSSEYKNAKELLNQKYIERQSFFFELLKEEAKKHNISIKSSTATHVGFAPIVNGEALSQEEFQELDDDSKDEIAKSLEEFELIVKEAIGKVGELNKNMQMELKLLDTQTTEVTVGIIIDEVSERYSHNPLILDYFDAMKKDIVEHASDFLAKRESDNDSTPSFLKEYSAPSFKKYEINILISHVNNDGAPVIYEDNPTYNNLLGHIEHTPQIGTLVTDFTQIKPGSLHRANGGYLIIDVQKLFTQPFAWDGLKRALTSKEINMEPIGSQHSTMSAVTLEPEPIPLDVKVILVGERIYYYLLSDNDPEFRELFKVTADFEEDMQRDENNTMLYVQMVNAIAKKSDLISLEKSAICRLVEQSSRNAQDSLKLSTHLRTLSDLLKESDYWARKEKSEKIKKEHIDMALKAQERRLSRVQERLYEQISDGTIMINVSGDVVGQINALTVMELGGYRFGAPTRVTARTRMGKGEIVDIQRKVELGGPIHTKGVMILTSYLSAKYAHKSPLSLWASLAFEQSYGMVDGDSASSTELYAILSSLSEVPIKQNFAVTGSVNQFGEIQAIGGVNEKIEGFYKIASTINSNGGYGIVIPKTNIKHLMLKGEVRDAVERGELLIYGISNIDEGVEILTGIEAGVADEYGNYADGSINGRVVAKLKSFTEAAKKYMNSSSNQKSGLVEA